MIKIFNIMIILNLINQNTLKLRLANIEDIDSVTEIYNEAIFKTNATFDTEPKKIDDQIKWFKDHGPNNPIIIAEYNNKIVGWASLSKWSDRCAYSDTAEISLYVTEKYIGKGIGRRLIEGILLEGQKTDIHTVLARITEGNDSSIHLHKSVGFEHIGIMKEVGWKFGKRLDVFLMQKIYQR